MLIEHVTADPGVGLFTAVLPFVRPGAGADAEDQSSAAESVQCRGLPGDHHGPAAGQRGDQGAEPDGGGADGRRGQGNPRVDHVHQPWGEGEQVIPEEKPSQPAVSATSAHRARSAASTPTPKQGTDRP